MNKTNITLLAYEPKTVDNAAKKVIKLAMSENVKFRGPIPMPNNKKIFTVLRSYHIYKKSREQFQRTTHKRLIILEDVSEKTLDLLKRLELPHTVQILVK